MKLLVAGNPHYGLAQAIAAKQLGGVYYSRTHNNTDLTNVLAQKQFAVDSLQYDVTIIVSCLYGYEQVKLTERVAKEWSANKHQGYLIVLGSSADTPVKGTAWGYPAEKKALRAYCRQLSQMSAGENEHRFRVTYLSPGNMHTPKQDEKMPGIVKLNTGYVADVVAWLTSQPKSVNISELTLDAIP
jgi:NAD(P)-dependent dehydrogenase (short-subunit alcohol dehydrogenase family)